MAAGDRSTATKSKQRQNNQQAAAPVAPRSSGGTIAVGCKLPHGMHLDFNKPGEPLERVTLKGTNSLQSILVQRISTIGGFAVTEGVPRLFFERWLRDHKDHPAVVNGLIFHHAQTASVNDMGRERDGDLKTGLEPMDPRKLPKGIKADTGKDTSEDD